MYTSNRDLSLMRTLFSSPLITPWPRSWLRCATRVTEWQYFMQNQKHAKRATVADILNGPKPKYRTTVLVPNGKHSPTYQTVMSHQPPTSKDVALKSAHNRQGMPTGC